MSTTAPAAAQIKAETAWQQSILQKSRSGVGCFEALYPASSWQSVPCSKAPAGRKPLFKGVAPADVGNGGNDFGLQVSTQVYRMKGSFDSVTGLTSITGGKGSSSNFALQLNASPFVPPACKNALVPAKCSGTSQFIYSNQGQIYVEYWLFHYAKGCPQYWSAYYDSCYFDSPKGSVPVQAIGNLKNLVLYADADLSGDYDYATIQTAPGVLYSASYYDNVLSLSKFWSGAEFNIYGDEDGSETFLNNGVTIGVRLSLPLYGAGEPAPTCVLANSFLGATAEFNNLDISSHCGADSDSIAFQESKTPTSGGPIIVSFSPHSGYATGGTSVTLTGFHFDNVTSVTFDGTPVTFTTPSDTEMDIAHVPPCSPVGCPLLGAVIEAYGGAKGGLTGSDDIGPFHEVPYVQSISPSDGAPGAQVTVTGNGFYNPGPSTPVFYFGSVQAPNVYCPPATRNTQCTMNAPIQEPNGVPVIFGNTIDATAATWTYNGLNYPYIDGVNPPSGPQAGGTTVVITGSGFTQQMEAAFGSTYVGMTGDCPTSTQCTVETPRSTTAGSVPVSVGGYAEGSPVSPPNANASFDYLAAPPSGSLSPSAGGSVGGTAVTIGMIGFDAFPGSVVDFDFGGKTTRINHATCQLNPENGSNSYCTLQTPPLPSTLTPPAAVPVSVTYNGSTLAVGSFTYEAPSPGSISPDTGPVTGGTNITVHVNNLLAATGAVVNFSFNGKLTAVPNAVCTVDAGNTGNSTCTGTTLPLPAGETAPAEIPVSVTAQGKSVTVGNFQYGHQLPPPTQCQICRKNGGICTTKNGRFVCTCPKSSPTGACE